MINKIRFFFQKLGYSVQHNARKIGRGIDSAVCSMFDVRMKTVWIITVIALGYIAYFHTAALSSVALVLGKMTLGGITGMWTDRGLFPTARPTSNPATAAWHFREAGLVAAGMIAAGLGV